MTLTLTLTPNPNPNPNPNCNPIPNPKPHLDEMACMYASWLNTHLIKRAAHLVKCTLQYQQKDAKVTI